jgi:hypothetical protein
MLQQSTIGADIVESVHLVVASVAAKQEVIRFNKLSWSIKSMRTAWCRCSPAKVTTPSGARCCWHHRTRSGVHGRLFTTTALRRHLTSWANSWYTMGLRSLADAIRDINNTPRTIHDLRSCMLGDTHLAFIIAVCKWPGGTRCIPAPAVPCDKLFAMSKSAVPLSLDFTVCPPIVPAG